MSPPAMDDLAQQNSITFVTIENVGKEYPRPEGLPITDNQLEDVYYLQDTLSTSGYRRTDPWWKRIAQRLQDTATGDGGRDSLSLGDLKFVSGKAEALSRRRRSRYNYCVFAGISGSTILAFLLFVNFLLAMANLIWARRHDDGFLSQWGKPGTGTEGLAWYPTDFTRDIRPMPCHSHNDYWRKVPLFSALRAGAIGVEADVWHFDNELYVGHSLSSLSRNRTLRSLYVDPLVEILDRQNPQTEFANTTVNGVYDTDPDQSLTLLIDVKTGGEETWPIVLEHLQPLRDRGWLSFVEDGTLNKRPIIVVGTGNTPFDLLTANTTYRDAFFDAPLERMWEAENVSDRNEDGEEVVGDPIPFVERDSGQGNSGVTPTTQFDALNSYYASVSFNKAVGALWRGRLSAHQVELIRGQIRGAHARGLKARYWDLPSWPLGLRNHIWDVLVREGVDYLNVDDLRAASKKVW